MEYDNQTIKDSHHTLLEKPSDNTVSQDNPAGNTVSQDNTAGNTVSQDKTAGDTVSQDKTTANTVSQDKTAGNTVSQDNPAGNIASQDNSAGDSASQDKTTGDTASQDKITGDTVSQDKTAGNTVSQDKTTGNTVNQDNELRQEEGRPHDSLPRQDEFTAVKNSLRADSMEEETSEQSQADGLISSGGEISEADASSVWRSNQVVEEVVVRRRKGSSTNDASELGSKTVIETHDAYTLEEDDSVEAVKRRDKMKRIRNVLSSEPLDLETLKELAISKGGLLDDEVRKEAWPLLMGLKLGEAETKPKMEVVEGHRDYQQVVLDVKRTLKRFPPGIEDSRRVVLMDQLIVLIIRVLMRHPELYYYQGYHDVAITFLLVTGEDMGFQLVEKLSVTHLRDFMRATMEKTSYYLTYLYPILENAHPLLHECLEKSGVGTVFCLPWLITWFAHTLSDYRHVVRLYDFFLASPDLMPMYIATAIVLQKEEELLGDKEREVSSIFAILSKDPDNLPFEDILVRARELYQCYPPDTLTERVDKIIAKREEEEKREKQRIDEIRKKADSYRKNTTGLMGKILAYLPVPVVIPAQRGKIIKLALFTASIILARSLYKHYYTSAIDFPLHTQ